MEEKVKYFPEESLSFWDKLRCFSGMWEQVETGKYLPIVISEERENLGVDGNPDEIAEAQHGAGSYMVSGWPSARYIGCREYANTTFLFWKDEEGKYYSDIVGVMEVERWFREIQEQDKKKKNSIRLPPDAG